MLQKNKKSTLLLLQNPKISALITRDYFSCCEQAFFLLPHLQQTLQLLFSSNRYKQEITVTHNVSIKYFGLRMSQLQWHI